MAGHIAGLGYSQRIDANGRPLEGWRLYIYDTGTSTPVTSYVDYALSIEHTHPIEADSSGVMPMFWVADGTYRVRGTDADGNELFDDSGVVALGPSSGTGGGSSSSVAASAIFQTGDILWQPISGTRTGWVRCNARTIGSVASGGTERANADCEELFLYLWTNFSNSLCPVTGGRGGSAAADWAANKLIATLDMRSKTIFGDDGMGNTNAGVTGGSTIAAAAVGASTIRVLTANLPTAASVSLSGVSIQSTFSLSLNSSAINGDTSMEFIKSLSLSDTAVPASPDNVNVLTDVNGATTFLTLGVADKTVVGTISSSLSGTGTLNGNDTDIDVLTPARIGTYYMKL